MQGFIRKAYDQIAYTCYRTSSVPPKLSTYCTRCDYQVAMRSSQSFSLFMIFYT